MLHKDPNIISPATFLITQKLQSLPELNNFYLVGGTALALQLGHRNSIDIDLFSQKDFNDVLMIEFLKSNFTFEETYVRKNTIIGFINKIKVDFITHPYNFVKPPITEEGISFLSKEDITAMKLNAIVSSGQRLKDFIDIYFLLEHFCIKDMLQFYETKYPDTNPLIALKAISYFEDLDESIEPPKVSKPLPLKKVKERINKAVLNKNKIFHAE